VIYLQASSAGLTAACASQTITVSPGPFNASQSLIVTKLTDNSATSTSGTAITVAAGTAGQGTVSLTVKDAYGNLNPTGITTVTFSDSVVTGSADVTFVASVSGPTSSVYTQAFTGSVSGKVKIAASVDGTSVTTATEINNATVSAGSATKLSFNATYGGRQPSSSNVAGNNLSTQPKVVALDSSNNIDTSYTSSIVLTAFSDSGCTSAIATTPNGSGHTLGAASVSLNATSGASDFTGVQANYAGNVDTRFSGQMGKLATYY
jgi:hypothetical protein